MNSELLIKNWLDNDLNSEEQLAVEQLDDYKDLIKLNSALSDFRAPGISIENGYDALKPLLKSEVDKSNPWFKPLLKIAALLALGFSVYYYSATLDSEFNTNIAQQTTISLPDTSVVDLNANSTLTFNENHWSENREVNLNGEAFFKVAKGEKFVVITKDGIVTVLGTQFNVKQRQLYFEVTCYEGLVAVTHNNKTVNLSPGHTFRVIDGKLLANEKENAAQPSWLRGESSFKNVPLKYVISEFKNQYNLKIDIDNIDVSRQFTGSFTHKNLDLALQSITIPLNLNYSKTKKSILLKRE
jgi:ferric-dicitrate binding protein FerR (iron transport regulator)